MNKDKRIEQILEEFQNKFFRKLFYEENDKKDFDWALNTKPSNDEDYGNYSIGDIMDEMKRFIKDHLNEIYEAKNLQEKQITPERVKALVEEAYEMGQNAISCMKLENSAKKGMDIKELLKDI